jgi:hypothetical protein
MSSHPDPSSLDGNQVLQHAFEDTTGRLRVDAQITPDGGATEVIIDHADDSIRLGDGTDLVTTTTVSGNVGLDVNLIGGSITIGGLATPTVTNVAIPTANTEQSHMFAATVKKFIIKSRERGKLQIAYSSGQTGTKYITVRPGSIYCMDDLQLAGVLTLYFRSSKANDVLEVESWA